MTDGCGNLLCKRTCYNTADLSWPQVIDQSESRFKSRDSSGVKQVIEQWHVHMLQYSQSKLATVD
jgi:hypothetical protein